jgi:hypothetical protein
MRDVDRYLAELAAALRVRVRARRRFLRECRDHLEEAASERGVDDAIRAFGPPPEIAAAFDAEVTAGRSVRSTFATLVAVLATAGSTLVLVNSASSDASAPVAWAIAFFVCAQIAGVAAGLALVQALAHRRAPMEPAQAMLLTRRNICALIAASMTLVAAAGAVTGRGSAALILAGPACVCVALVTVLRARSLGRRLEGAGTRAVGRPLQDIGRLVGVRLPEVDPVRLLVGATSLAVVAAFVRDRVEDGSVGNALMTAGIEAAAVVACYAVLGPALGLRRR